MTTPAGPTSTTVKTTGVLVVLVTAGGLSGVVASSCAPRATDAHVLSRRAVPQYELLELELRQPERYGNPFVDVGLEATFTAPSGRRRDVGGFFYADESWKVRFRPDEIGAWSYVYRMVGPNGLDRRGDGSFDTTTGSSRGPVRQNTRHPFRWMFANGEPYFPIGVQDCVRVRDGALEGIVIDGEAPEDTGPPVSMESYFETYGQAGFNLFRFSQDNCSFALFEDGRPDRPLEAEGLATDVLLAAARDAGFRVMFGFFGFTRSGQSPTDRERQQRFIRYCVARWGAYVDFWQLLNEQEASDEWTTTMAEFVRLSDPDEKPISTSWERPDLPAIDVNTPHWYETEDELDSDLRVRDLAAGWKRSGKPVIVGEQGNVERNWDPGSGRRMRIRAWTALFNEITLVFWNTSWSKRGMRFVPGRAANIYLGPEERTYVRVLQDATSRLDADVEMIGVRTSAPDAVRAYGLRSARVVALYLHHFARHDQPARDVEVTVEGLGPRGLPDRAIWIDPATGRTLGRVEEGADGRRFGVPAFNVDVVLLAGASQGAMPVRPEPGVGLGPAGST